jgi:hypothetical protein
VVLQPSKARNNLLLTATAAAQEIEAIGLERPAREGSVAKVESPSLLPIPVRISILMPTLKLLRKALLRSAIGLAYRVMASFLAAQLRHLRGGQFRSLYAESASDVIGDARDLGI